MNYVLIKHNLCPKNITEYNIQLTNKKMKKLVALFVFALLAQGVAAQYNPQNFGKGINIGWKRFNLHNEVWGTFSNINVRQLECQK